MRPGTKLELDQKPKLEFNLNSLSSAAPLNRVPSPMGSELKPEVEQKPTLDLKRLQAQQRTLDRTAPQR